MNSTLLIGNYDWNAEHMPKEEFQERIRAFWKRMPDPQCAGVAVYGDRRNNAELAYFSHLVPKLRDAVALIPRNGEPKMLVAGGANAMPPAARQTWIANNEPLSDLGKAVAQWKKELDGPVAVVGTDGARLAMQKSVAEALGSGDASTQLSNDAGDTVRAMMRVKTARELQEIRRGCAMLKAAAGALQEAVRAGRGVTDCMAEAEHEAVKMRAMEVRSLYSLDGGKTLRPFISPLAQNVNPLQAYLAVRSGGYWVDAHVRTGAPGAAAAKAGDALKQVIAAMKPGAVGKDLVRIAKDAVAPCGEHPMVKGEIAHAIGLALEEEPRLSAGSDTKLEAGGVYSLCVGASDGKDHAIASAIVAVSDRGSETLFST